MGRTTKEARIQVKTGNALAVSLKSRVQEQHGALYARETLTTGACKQRTGAPASSLTTPSGSGGQHVCEAAHHHAGDLNCIPHLRGGRERERECSQIETKGALQVSEETRRRLRSIRRHTFAIALNT